MPVKRELKSLYHLSNGLQVTIKLLMHVQDNLLVMAGQPDLLAATGVQPSLNSRNIGKILSRN